MLNVLVFTCLITSNHNAQFSAKYTELELAFFVNVTSNRKCTFLHPGNNSNQKYLIRERYVITQPPVSVICMRVDEHLTCNQNESVINGVQGLHIVLL